MPPGFCCVAGNGAAAAISDPMRELIEDLWPELVDKLPPKGPHT
jgi:hypothetical protein